MLQLRSGMKIPLFQRTKTNLPFSKLNKMKKLSKINTLLYLLLFTVIGCTSNDHLETISHEGTQLSVRFIASGDTDETEDSKNKTRVNRQLSSQDLSFYLFQKDNKGNTSFVFAPEKSKIEVNKTSTTAEEYIAHFKIPGQNYGNIILVSLANYYGSDPSMGQSIESFQNENLIKIHSGIISSKHKPMWGTSEFKTNSNNIRTEVALIRALARVNIELVDTRSEAQFEMLDISSVRIYRTWNRSTYYVDSNHLNNSGTVTSPTIPQNVEYNLHTGTATSSITEADKYPLLYDFSSTPVKDITNLIYIPEAQHASDAKRDQVVAIVVGVHLNNDTQENEERFYRIDFANYNKGSLEPTNFFSILRNHSYLFHLSGAMDKGEATPEEALNAKSSLLIDIIAWEDFNVEVVSNGQYSFGIEVSDIVLNEKAGSSIQIPFKTNLSDGELNESFIFKWNDNKDTSDIFDIQININRRNIVIKTKTENNTNHPIKEILYVTVLNHVFTFEVTQVNRTPDYIVSQKNWKVNGVYVRNKPLEPGIHTANIRLYAANKEVNLEGLPYSIEAKEIEGIFVKAEGIFDNIQIEDGLQYQDITIDIQGKSNKPKNKNLTLVTDGYSASFLNLEIPYAYRPKTIVGFFGSSSTNKLSTNSNFKKLFNTSANFGVTENSAVKVEKVEYIESESYDIQSVIDSHKPDILILGEDYHIMSPSQLTALLDFIVTRNDLGAPGVVIFMNTSPSITNLLMNLNATTNSTNIEKLKVRAFDAIHPQDDGNTDYRYHLPVYDWDKVVNGAFGSLGTKYIQLNENAIGITNLRMEKLLKFTGNLPFGKKHYSNDRRVDYATSSLRLADYALLWIGSDDFLKSNQWLYNSDKLVNRFELTYNSKVEGNKGMVYCNNSLFFANALHWAMHTSEYGLK